MTKIFVDSEDYPEQKSHDLKVTLDREIRDVKEISLNFVGLSNSFYNISHERQNNAFLIDDGFGRKYVTLPNGYYNPRTFERAFSNEMRLMNYPGREISFEVERNTGKINVIFRKGSRFKLYLAYATGQLLGFDVWKGRHIILPRQQDEFKTSQFGQISFGDKPADFLPFKAYYIHCDLIDPKYNFFNEKTSTVLARLPLKTADFGETVNYNMSGFKSRPICKSNFNSFRIWITDENGNMINLNNFPVSYEVTFLH